MKYLTFRTLAQSLLLFLLLCAALTTTACGRKPAKLDEQPGAITYTYPPEESAK